MTNPLIVEELRKIAKAHDGILKPEDVVDAARSKTSVLHDQFEWDDSAAAEQFRLYQARNLVRVTVTFVNDVNQRVFVSLTPDRKDEGGGYRELVSVLSNKNQREQLLEDAMAEMECFRNKYAALKELAEVFAAMKKFKRKSIAA